MSDYTTVATFKDAIKFTGNERDAEFAKAITAASRIFDRITKRADNAFVATTATRTFDGASGQGDHLWVPSLLAVTTLKTDHDGDGSYETAWASTDYMLYPLDGPPYQQIVANRTTGRYLFPVGQATVEIAGSWGRFAAVPSDVERAVILLAHRLTNRAKTPEGIMGSLDQGFVQMRDLDPDVKAIAAHYVDVEALFA